MSDDQLFEISLAQWSLHRTIQSGQLEHLDFARVAKSDFGINAIEYVNTFFKDKAADRGYLQQMKQRAQDQGVTSLLIMVDGEGKIADPDTATREQAVRDHYKWVEAAKFLGCHAIRINAHGEGSYDDQLGYAGESLHRLAEFGQQHQINILVENHWGFSSNPAWLAALMTKVDHLYCGTLPDFGNWDDLLDRYQSVAGLMPFAKAVSAKAHKFDTAGNDTRTDYRQMLKVVTDAGYHGYVGIEYEGDVLSEYDGVRATKRLLEQVRNELAT